MERPPSPHLIERFRVDLHAVWPDVTDPGQRLGIALSGGSDSTALLLLAHAALPGRVVAATIDHGLRAEGAAEAAFAARTCERLGVPHETVAVEVERGNLQDRARAARYSALMSVFGRGGATTFATAHHADDQAETVLMRLARGSGLAGLSGIRSRRIAIEEPYGEYLVVRPLLHWRRAELAAVVAAAGIEPVRDPSNEDDRFDRVRTRRMLAQMPDLDPVAIARSADWLQDAEDVIAERVDHVCSEHVIREGDIVWFRYGWPRLIELEVVGAILRSFGADAPRSAVAKLVAQMRSEGHATLAGVEVHRAMHRVDPLTEVQAWRFKREGLRRSG